MRAIGSNQGGDGVSDNPDFDVNDIHEEIDPLLDGTEGNGTDEGNGGNVSSKSSIKTMVTSKGIVAIGMIVVSIFMIYSTFFSDDKDVEESKQNTGKAVGVPLAKREVKQNGRGTVVSKEEDQGMNPFIDAEENSKSLLGSRSMFEDPELPSLDLSRDNSYTDPIMPDLRSMDRDRIPGDSSIGKRDSSQDYTSVPSWVNPNSNEIQINPQDPFEQYDPKGMVLYKNGEKHRIVPLNPYASQQGMPNAGSDADGKVSGMDSPSGFGADVQPDSQSTAYGTPTTTSVADARASQLTDKRRLSMFVVQGMPPSTNQKKKKKSDFIVMDESVISERKTNDNKGDVKKLSNLDTSILGGKIVEATMETAINTQVPGNARAIVSRDVFAEAGDKVLIPKGSRLYGTYSSNVSRGESRIRVSWSRMVRPDGVDVTISAQASDQFGRTGIQGDVDNRIGDSIANSMLISLTTLGAGLLAQQLGTGQGQSQVVNPNGTFTTTNITPLNYAAQAAIQTATDMVSSLTQGAISLAPVISLSQGTKIIIVMDQDLRLPPFKKVTL